MMVVGQRFGEFEPGVVVVGDDAGDCPDLFEYRQIAVQARLGQFTVESEDLGDRHRPLSVVQGSHDPSSAGGVSMVARPQQPGDVIVQQIGGHAGEATVSGNN